METKKPMNADIEFLSAEHVLEEIDGMRVKGGSPFGRSAAWAFKLAIEQEELGSKEALLERIDDLSAKLTALKPTMGTIANTIHFVHLCYEQHEQESLEAIKAAIVKLCERIVDTSLKAVRKLGEYGGALIHDGDTVMMHSYSSSLMSCFEQAAKNGVKFKMICTESRPLRESRLAVKMLQSFGIPVTYITDASIWEFLPTWQTRWGRRWSRSLRCFAKCRSTWQARFTSWIIAPSSVIGFVWNVAPRMR